MNELKEYKFAKLYEISSGLSSTKDQAGHGAPFLSFSSVFNNFFLPDSLVDKMDTSIEEQKRYSIKEGDIFLTRTSETLDELAMSSVAIKDYPHATYSGFLKRLRPLQTNITYAKFMAFYLRSSYFRKIIDNNATMTLRASFNEDMFSWLNLCLPKYEVQKKIGDFLYTIEQKIKNNNYIINILESMAKTLYDYWFVQFDFPDANGRPYKTSGGKMVWNEELGREIPEGWECNYLKDIAKITTSSINPQTELDYLHYSIPAFDAGMVAKKEKGVEINSNKYIVPPNSILVSKLNPQFQRIWFISETGENSICSTEFIPFTPINGRLGLIYAILSSSMFHQFMIQCSSSSTGSRKRMDPNMCLDYKFAYPNNDDLINTLDSIVQSAKYKTFNLLEENQQLITLRDFLLPMLMNGQVTFK